MVSAPESKIICIRASSFFAAPPGTTQPRLEGKKTDQQRTCQGRGAQPPTQCGGQQGWVSPRSPRASGVAWGAVLSRAMQQRGPEPGGGGGKRRVPGKGPTPPEECMGAAGWLQGRPALADWSFAYLLCDVGQVTHPAWCSHL